MLTVADFAGKYYLYGIGFGGGGQEDIRSYSSVDLVNWEYKGVVRTPGGGRPHVVFNPTTSKYVLWTNSGNGYQVSTSSSPTSSFATTGNASLEEQYRSLQAADAGVVAFGNEGYLVGAVLNFNDPRAGSIWPPIYQTMHISPLNKDFTALSGGTYNVTSAAFDDVDQQAESPDLFIRNNRYYVVTSNTCGFCSGSIGVVYHSDSIKGPWQRNIVAGYSCSGQVEGVLPLTDPTTNETTYVWHSTTTPGGPRIAFSGHVFQPLKFSADSSVKELDCSEDARFEVAFTKGDGDAVPGKIATAADLSPRFTDYHPVCDSDLFYGLYQTWENSKAGTLREVGVNIAAGGNAVNLVIRVFRFSNISDLVSAGYKWTLLGSTTFRPAQLTQTFGVASVNLSSPVKKGDMLGFAINEENFMAFSAGNFVPYCHLEYTLPANASSSQVLLEQGSGQNSPRGLSGKVSPVQVRKGKGVKFFTTVD